MIALFNTLGGGGRMARPSTPEMQARRPAENEGPAYLTVPLGSTWVTALRCTCTCTPLAISSCT